MATPSDAFWDDLFLYIEEGKVIPVIGPELVTVSENGVTLPLVRWLAPRLAAAIHLSSAELPANFTLNDVVLQHMKKNGARAKLNLYSWILKILREARLQPAPALQALAAIPGLNLFVTLTFDTLLADAIGTARPGVIVEQIAYSRNPKPDLPHTHDALKQPVVYHLLGKISSSPVYAICDDDVLEFVHALQNRTLIPELLFDELQNHHLLILGCEFSDWLARFFLRAVRGIGFAQARTHNDFLIGQRPETADPLVMFLDAYGTETFSMQPESFIAELARRWQHAHPKAQADAEARAVPGGLPAYGAVFISYATEDVEIAQRLANDLDQAGIDVWFDRRNLEPACDWANSIERGIERCAVFLPVISHATLSENNIERYFWREWNIADHRARGMAQTAEFILPVLVADDLRMDRLPITLPRTFTSRQGVNLPAGASTREFNQKLQELVRNAERRRSQRQ